MLTLRVGGVPEHFNLPWLLAIENDAFASLGVDLQFIEYPGGTGAMAAALAAHEIDVALMLTEGAVLDILKGGDHRLVSVFVTSPLVWGIHVPGKSKLESPGQMEGRTIAISRYGSGSHLIAVVDALERGFNLQDMSFRLVGDLEGAREALGTGQAEVFLWERHMTQPLVDSGEFRRIGERVVPWPAFVVSVRRSVLDAHGSSLRSVLDVVARQARGLKHEPDAAALIAQRYGLAMEDAQRWLQGVEWNDHHARPDAALDRVLTALEAQGALAGSADTLTDPWRDLP